MSTELPAIPPKRYFTIGEVSELCAVKPYVLRYWEQEFTQLRPMKRRGNRRYYQHHEVLLVRRIRELLYEQRFTISGARDRLAEALIRGTSARALAEAGQMGAMGAPNDDDWTDDPSTTLGTNDSPADAAGRAAGASLQAIDASARSSGVDLRRELLAIRRLLSD